MIVREIKQNPVEVLRNFDWFNDYKDTRSWAVGQGLTEIVDGLDIGHEKWINKRLALFQ